MLWHVYGAIMSHDLLNSVAATTTHRDRDELDRAVARLLLQFLELHSVTLLRLTEEGEIKRLVRLTASEAGSGAAAAGDDFGRASEEDRPTGQVPVVGEGLLFATPRGNLLHRDECPVVARRNDLKTVAPGTEGYGYCAMCNAGVPV